MLHLKSITVRKWPDQDSHRFPFNLPVLSSLQEMVFSTPVTFFVGENGSRKSTLLEAIACAAGSIRAGACVWRRCSLRKAAVSADIGE